MNALRSKLAALALSCLLLPWGGLLAVWARSGAPASCGMQCCRRSGRCCCRKDQHQPAGAAWRAQNRCPDGCRTAPLARGAAAALTPARTIGATARVCALVRTSVPSPARDSSPLTRRGRAPPLV